MHKTILQLGTYVIRLFHTRIIIRHDIYSSILMTSWEGGNMCSSSMCAFHPTLQTITRPLPADMETSTGTLHAWSRRRSRPRWVLGQHSAFPPRHLPHRRLHHHALPSPPPAVQRPPLRLPPGTSESSDIIPRGQEVTTGWGTCGRRCCFRRTWRG